MRWSRLIAPMLALAGSLAAQPGSRKMVAVVAAASLRPALEEAKAAYGKAHPDLQLQIGYGASGSLTAQIQQGAPVDLFLSADLAFPARLVQEGLATKDGAIPYARGVLVLWIRKDTGLDPGRLGLKVLLNPAVRRIALANPKLAPYGLAAETALRKAGLLETLLPRVVLAENINQAVQYLYTGAAEAGFIARSLADNPVLKDTGRLWPVPNEFYEPIVQGAIILRRSEVPTQSRQFLDYLITGDGFRILQRYGFERP